MTTDRVIHVFDVKAGGGLIAAYMGATTVEDRKEGTLYNLPGSFCLRTWSELKYDKLWDRLIPVWAKVVAELDTRGMAAESIRLFDHCVRVNDIGGCFLVVVNAIRGLKN